MTALNPASTGASERDDQKQPVVDQGGLRQTVSSSAVVGLVLRVTVDAKPDRMGAIWCDVTVENTGEDYARLPIYMEPAYWLSVFVTDEAGNKLDYTGPRMKPMWPDAKFPLAPGYYWGRRFNLRRDFRMERPGRYRVTVEYGNPPGGVGLLVGPLKVAPVEVTVPR